MQERKITVKSTKNQSVKVIMSEAETLGQLKEDFTKHGIDYEDMIFFEGTSKVELFADEAILPRDVPFRGTLTNELVFLLTNKNKKIASGMEYSREELYAYIKLHDLQNKCYEKFSRNYTLCKNSELMELVREESEKEYKCEVNSTNTALDKAFIELVTILEDNYYLTEDEARKVFGIMNEESQSEIESPYTDDEIDDMFLFIK